MTSPIPHDRFGPEVVLTVYDSHLGMEGFLVIDNTALGVGKGGIRMTSSVTAYEVSRLARAMTWKNALARIPFGGAKAGIVWPGGSEELKKQFIQSFARRLQPFLMKQYIAGPDVNTTKQDMKHFVEAVGNFQAATGKPADYCVQDARGKNACGIPHEYGSTGYGVAHAASTTAAMLGLKIQQVTVAIEGFGNVGSFAAQFLHEMGAKIVAVADRTSTVYEPSGIDLKTVRHFKADGKTFRDYPKGQKLTHDDIFALPVDMLIPATVTDVINESNKDRIKAKIIVEGANIPMRENIEEELYRRGIMVLPDFVTNAGGVISSYAEHCGLGSGQMFAMVKEKITATTQAVMRASLVENQSPRAIAMAMAQKIVENAMEKREKADISASHPHRR